MKKKLEQHKESLDNKEKQLAEAKIILVAAKQSFHKLAQKTYIEHIKSQFQQQNQRQQLEFLKQQNSFHNNSRPKKCKKEVLEEESENESKPEFEEDKNFETEKMEEESEVKKPKRKNKSSNVFEYINQNAKRHKR